MQKKSSNKNFDTFDKNPNNWKGIFYFNRKDSRIFVPKINPSMGWTINMANPFTYVLFVLIILFIIALKFII